MTTPRACTFDPERHEYAIDGRFVPSVTQVVRRFAPFPFACDPWYLQRGTQVHAACSLLVHGHLDTDTVDQRIAGHVEACRKFLSAMKFGEAWTEEHLYDARGQFAGTPDLYADGALIDWKCSTEPGVEIQIGGYCELLNGTPKRCMSVELHEDGTFRVDEYSPKRCLGLWRAAFSVWQWQKANGYIKDERE